jgi:hypothetical protein
VRKLLIGLFLVCLSFNAFAKDYSASIKGTISDSSMEKAIEACKKAGKGDTVTLYVNSIGGFVSPFYALKKQLNGETLIVKGEKHVISCAACIMMLADKRDVAPGTIVLFHLGSVYLANGNKVKLSVYSIDPLIRALAYSALNDMVPYKKLFTTKEWDTLKKGDDVTVAPSRIDNVPG